jgi:aspartyl/glutamyl-tRNA(Asn/Gln) amidotransferase C subunit
VPSHEEVAAVARLARLSFTGYELDQMADELRAILAHVDLLRQVDAHAPGRDRPVDLHATAATGAVVGHTSLRADEPGADPLHVPPADLAPAWHAGFFTVPRLPSHRDSPPR